MRLSRTASMSPGRVDHFSSGPLGRSMVAASGDQMPGETCGKSKSSSTVAWPGFATSETGAGSLPAAKISRIEVKSHLYASAKLRITQTGYEYSSAKTSTGVLPSLSSASHSSQDFAEIFLSTALTNFDAPIPATSRANVTVSSTAA